MLGIVFSAAVLCAIMYVIARHEADYSFPRVLLISLGLGLTDFCLSLLVGPTLGSILVMGLMVWALHQFCYLRWRMAITVAAIYFASMILLGFVIGILTS